MPTRHRAQVLGFTDQIDELMAAADLVVSKPGGLTTSEVLARGAAMVIVNPIPGQESRNSDYLLENGAAIKVNNLATLAYKVALLLDDPTRMAQLRAPTSPASPGRRRRMTWRGRRWRWCGGPRRTPISPTPSPKGGRGGERHKEGRH